jgi:hypothetical protein
VLAGSHLAEGQAKRSVGLPIHTGMESDWAHASKVGPPNLQKPITYFQTLPRDAVPKTYQCWIVVRTLRNRHVERNVRNSTMREIVEIKCKPEDPNGDERKNQCSINQS